MLDSVRDKLNSISVFTSALLLPSLELLPVRCSKASGDCAIANLRSGLIRSLRGAKRVHIFEKKKCNLTKDNQATGLLLVSDRTYN